MTAPAPVAAIEATVVESMPMEPVAVAPTPVPAIPVQEFVPPQPPMQPPAEELPAAVSEPVVEAQEQPHQAVATAPEEAAQPPATNEERVRDETVTLPFPLQLDWSTDLIQVETNPEKYRLAQAKAQQEQPAPRVKRVRPPLPPLSDAPLIQVETRTSAASGQSAAQL